MKCLFVSRSEETLTNLLVNSKYRIAMLKLYDKKIIAKTVSRKISELSLTPPLPQMT